MIWMCVFCVPFLKNGIAIGNSILSQRKRGGSLFFYCLLKLTTNRTNRINHKLSVVCVKGMCACVRIVAEVSFPSIFRSVVGFSTQNWLYIIGNYREHIAIFSCFRRMYKECCCSVVHGRGKNLWLQWKKLSFSSILFMASRIRKSLCEIWHLYAFAVRKIYIELKRDEIVAAVAALAK